MWIVVVALVAVVFVIAVWAQLDLFNMKVTQLVQFKRISRENS
ncbi:MAG: hypothetical protein OXK72_03900 [Gammaproteobacteria bacterium]|nr:hypothetical protein [Gammaproteobacteria bacterium]MDE0411779.1 hypothetical protein [Gammaproteobacteria bacterium]